MLKSIIILSPSVNTLIERSAFHWWCYQFLLGLEREVYTHHVILVIAQCCNEDTLVWLVPMVSTLRELYCNNDPILITIAPVPIALGILLYYILLQYYLLYRLHQGYYCTHVIL